MKTNKTTKLALQPYKNLSGTTSWRITGWFLGERIRKNFKDKQDSLAEKSALDMRAAQHDADIRTASTFLTDEQLREPGSKWKLHRQWFRTTTLAELLGSDETLAQDDTLYHCHDLLLAHKEALFSHLRERWENPFSASYDILLYELTSTYFECDAQIALQNENDPRPFG